MLYDALRQSLLHLVKSRITVKPLNKLFKRVTQRKKIVLIRNVREKSKLVGSLSLVNNKHFSAAVCADIYCPWKKFCASVLRTLKDFVNRVKFNNKFVYSSGKTVCNLQKFFIIIWQFNL